MPLSGLVEMALFSNPAACFSSSGSVKCTKTSDSSRSITPGAGLTWEETKGPPSEQQGQFTAPRCCYPLLEALSAHQCTAQQFQWLRCGTEGLSAKPADQIASRLNILNIYKLIALKEAYGDINNVPSLKARMKVSSMWRSIFFRIVNPQHEILEFPRLYTLDLNGARTCNKRNLERVAFSRDRTMADQMNNVSACYEHLIEVADVTSHSIEELCRRWSDGHLASLWQYASDHARKSNSKQPKEQTKESDKKDKKAQSAVSKAREGTLLGKACKVLTSSGIPPTLSKMWNLIQQKHPKGPIPTVPDITLPSWSLLCHPSLISSGLCMQHLIDAAEVHLPISILRAVVNTLASGKAPMPISKYLAGGSLTALIKNKEGLPLDIRPIAVGEAMRRLKGKHSLRNVLLTSQNYSLGFLLLWAAPNFMAPYMRVLSSELGVQQGDPLGPLLFSLVLHKLIHTIIEDKNCSQLLINTWYLGDGVLSGTKSVICRAVTLIQKLGPALGLWINPAKCEWFSRTVVWSDFSQEMKVSHELNFEVLGAPIGDPIFCANFLTQRCAKAVKLLSQLVTVGSLDPQVALLLLRQCAGYCKLVHLARSTPPPLSLIDEAHGERSKQSIKEKCQKYLERAEALKKFLAKGKNTEKKLKDQIIDAIVQEKPNIKWSDIAGLQSGQGSTERKCSFANKVSLSLHWKTKTMERHSAVWGTGKTYLAKALATEADSTFFSIPSSDLVSKWLGESERLVKTLFELARANKPAVVFIDEVDSLCSARSDDENESTRRVKTEFLVQMQGVGIDNDGILVLGATNIPWGLDAAIRRRFEKRIYIPLPEEKARRRLFELNIETMPLDRKSEYLSDLANKTEGYSGADISIVVREALMMPIREVQIATHFKKVRGPNSSDPTQVLMICTHLVVLVIQVPYR
eukprot:Em0707g1a